MEKEEWMKSLLDEKNQELFQHMPASTFASAYVKRVKKGAFVVEKEEPIKEVMICCRGKMQVLNEFHNGAVYNFAYAEPVSYIGVMELIAKKTIYSAYLKAATDCELLVLPIQVFFDWFYKDQWLVMEVLTFLSKSMFERSFTVGEQRVYPANYQVVKYLIEQYEEARRESIFLIRTKEEMATLFCISTRTLHRVLKQLKEEEVITVKRNGVGISKEQYQKLKTRFEEMRSEL